MLFINVVLPSLIKHPGAKNQNPYHKIKKKRSNTLNPKTHQEKKTLNTFP
jgi:hypothetical protein